MRQLPEIATNPKKQSMSDIPSKSVLHGIFDRLSETPQEKVKCLAATYHIRNGVQHPDGSMGEIRITHAQLRDLLAYAYLLDRS
jgi:hypothetical protein